jgi:hypothetical protein
VSPGSGSVTTVQEQDAAGGGSDADIVVIDFQEGFSVAEAPDTEVNISLDVTPAVGKPTLVIEDDAINVLYDTTDFGEETTNGLVLGASPTIATSLAIGTDPADAGALRLANAGYIYSEKAVTGTDISVIGVDASDVVQIAASGSSGAVITPATTITGKITTGSSIELGHASDTTIKRDSAGVISVEDAVVTLLGATIGASEVDADVATQAELDAVAALVDTDDEIIAIINASPSTQISVAAGGTNSGTALTNDFVMVSSGGAIIESATVTATELALLNGETDLASQAELDAVAALVDTDDEIIAIINASPGTQIGVPAGGSGAGTFTDGGLLVGAGTGAFEALAVGLATEVLVGGGAGTNPAWGTDLPTAVTIGSAYVYRVGGTDVADADVVDTITASNYLPLAGGILTAEVFVDALGLEFEASDDIANCSSFSATGGGIFYDDSDNQFKKCENNVLTALDTDTGGAPALSAVTAPTAAWSIGFDDEEKITWSTAQNTAGNFFTIDNTVADVTNQVYLLNLDYSVDDDQPLADYIIAQDAGGTVFTLGQDGDIVTQGDADVVGDFTAGTITSDAGVGGTTITASTGFALGDTDYIGITGNEIITFNAAGTIVVSGAALDLSSGGITNVGTIADDAAISVISSGGAVTIESVVFTGGVVSGSTSLTDGTATLTGGALTGLTTPLTVAQGGTGATSNTPTNVTPVDAGNEAAAFYPLIVDGATGDQATETDAAFNYNPSTDTLTVVNLDVLGAPFPTDPGADRVLLWDDSETGAELVWSAVGAGDVLADGSVPFTGEVHFENNAAAATFGLVTTDADVVVAFDAVTAQGSITYMEDEDRFDFDNDVYVTGDLAIGANPADAGTGIRMSNNTVIEFEDSEDTGEVTALQVVTQAGSR